MSFLRKCPRLVGMKKMSTGKNSNDFDVIRWVNAVISEN
jgi:hypothetical protein